MPVLTTLTTVAGGGATAKKGFDAAKKFLGGIIGGRPEPNAGTSNFTDVIDNYENVSTTRARMLEPEIVQMIRSGASDTQIAGVIARAGNYSVSQVMGSWKWGLVKDYINQVRSQVQVTGSRNSGSVVDTGSDGLNIPVAVWGALGLLLIFIFNR